VASIKKRDNGKWRARYRDATGKEIAAHFDTKKAAQDWLDNVTASIVRHDYVDPGRGRMTVGDWAENWLAGRVNLKPKTTAGYQSLWTTQIAPMWRKVPLASVTNADVAKWVANMTNAGKSPSRVRQAFHLFGAILADAVRDRRLASNPALGVRLPRMPRAEDHYLTHAQLDTLAGACGDQATLVRVLGYCGLRWGEAAALRVGRVDVLHGRLDIAEALTEVGGRIVFGAPKTHQRRAVPVPTFLRDDLAKACQGKRRDDFVFTARRGGVLRVGPFRRDVWNPACITVGLGEVRDGRYRGTTPPRPAPRRGFLCDRVRCEREGRAGDARSPERNTDARPVRRAVGR
jgi:integrase